MRIILLPSPEGDVIAREDQLGQLEAEFVLGPEDQVFYRHPLDSRQYLTCGDAASFREAAISWNRYCDEVQGKPEREQLEAVGRLRSRLTRLGILESRSDNLWAVLLEQAEGGLL